jgi:threonine aldolase
MAKLYIKRFGGYMMHSFMNDYSEGAHPRILELLVKSNFQQNKGYGEDVHSERAREYIRRALKREDVDIHFIPGGTMTNLLVISALLRPHQCVISPDTGHINVHETGAIEATGHKVIATPSVEGKLTPGSIQAALDYHKGEHMVQPKIIYISNSTELGTIYSKAELTAIHDICRQNDLILFLDGARIGSALMAKTNDLSRMTSTLGLPMVVLVAINCLFMFDGHTSSLSIMVILPIPPLIKASTVKDPTPPIPNTATLEYFSLLTPSVPIKSSVLEN